MAVIVFVICHQNSRGMLVPPWNINTREHLFGSSENASIEDEGFRWKNSFNFTIDAPDVCRANKETLYQIPKDKWVFNKIIQQNNNGGLVASTEWNNGTDANLIHQHLSLLIDKTTNCNSVTIAALTMVAYLTKWPNTFFCAYSKVISNAQNKPYIAVISKQIDISKILDKFALITLAADGIRNNLKCLDSQIPSIDSYTCTEGKFLAQLLNSNMALLKSEVDILFKTACADQQITPDAVKLIVLHIGTKMDPCAICTRNLVGLSRNINYITNNIEPKITLGKDINVKFLIEVSSNGHYQTQQQGNNFHNKSEKNYGSCFHTECAGHDNNYENLANIDINKSIWSLRMNEPILLAVPHGKDNFKNWIFQRSFPPYIIFGRIQKGNLENAANTNNICGQIDTQKHTAPASSASHNMEKLNTIN